MLQTSIKNKSAFKEYNSLINNTKNYTFVYTLHINIMRSNGLEIIMLNQNNQKNRESLRIKRTKIRWNKMEV